MNFRVFIAACVLSVLSAQSWGASSAVLSCWSQCANGKNSTEDCARTCGVDTQEQASCISYCGTRGGSSALCTRLCLVSPPDSGTDNSPPATPGNDDNSNGSPFGPNTCQVPLSCPDGHLWCGYCPN